jgi:hypothetical protein
MELSVDLKPFIDSLKSHFLSSGVSDAVEMAGKETIFTPINFTFIFESIQSFLEFGPTEFIEPFITTLKGLKEPKNEQADQFLLMKPLRINKNC